MAVCTLSAELSHSPEQYANHGCVFQQRRRTHKPHAVVGSSITQQPQRASPLSLRCMPLAGGVRLQTSPQRNNRIREVTSGSTANTKPSDCDVTTTSQHHRPAAAVSITIIIIHLLPSFLG
jgi:hypothetical protein